MTSFVESATLKVIDQSSGPINKINAELKKLFATANQLKRRGIDLGLRDTKAAAGAYSKAAAEAKKYAAAVTRGDQARLMSSREIIRAQRGLMKVERDLGAARQMSTEQMIRANRGVAKMVEAEAKAKQKAEQDILRGTERRIREIARAEQRAERGTFREADRQIREAVQAERTRAREQRRVERTAARGETPTAPVAFAGGTRIREFMTGILGANLVTAIGHQIKEGLIEGTKQYDVGENKLRLMQLDAVRGRGTEALARATLTNLGIAAAGMPGGAFLNAGQRMGIYAEALGTTSLDPRGAKLATAALEELVRTSVALGNSQERATDQAYNYVKAADMMGRMVFQHDTMVKDAKTLKETMHAAGTFRDEPATDAERAAAARRGIAPPDLGLKNFMDYMQKMQPEIGKEFTGEFVRGIAKYLGTTRFGVSNQAFGATLLLGEEMGTRAAVGYRQAVKQLSGIEQTVPRLEALTKLGLIGTHREGKKLLTDWVKDPALMAQNLPAWIAKNIAEGQGGPRYSELEKDEKKRGRLMDPNSPLAKIEKQFGRAFNLEYIEDVQDLARRLTGNSNAIDTLTGYLYNSAEIQKKLATVDKRDPEQVRKILMQSPVVAAAQLQNQFKGVMGAAVVAAAPVLTPMMQNLSGSLQTFSENIQTAMGPEGTPGKKEAREALLSAAATGAAGIGGLALTSQLMRPFLSGIGTAAAFQGLMDPKTAPMAGAAIALQGSAADLTAAAGALTASAAFGSKGLMDSLMTGAAAASPVGRLLAAGAWMFQNRATFDKEGDALLAAQAAAQSKFDTMSTRLGEMITAGEQNTDAFKILQAATTTAAQALKEAKEAWEQHKKADPFKELEGAGRPKVPEITPNDWKLMFNIPDGPKDALKNLPLPDKNWVRRQLGLPPDPEDKYETYKDRRGRKRRRLREDPTEFKGPGVRFLNPQILNPIFPTPAPIPRTGVTTTFPTVPTAPPAPLTAPPAWLDDLIRNMKVPPEGMDFVANATKQAAADLESSGSTMQTALSTGASDIRSAASDLRGAGAQAAGDMRSAAGGIGSAIASAFVAGASGVRIGVDLSGVPKPGNPGTQNQSATG